jgi:hypothetical protein
MTLTSLFGSLLRRLTRTPRPRPAPPRRPAVEALEDRSVPAIIPPVPPGTPPTPASLEVVANGENAPPRVQIFDGTSGARLLVFRAYRPGFRGGVRVALGDLNGDGVDEILAVRASGQRDLRVFDSRTGALLFTQTLVAGGSGGAFITSADVNGDSNSDIIVSVRNQIRIYNGPDQALLRVIRVRRNGPAPLAAADLNGDGRMDIVLGAGPSNPARLRIFDATTGARFQQVSVPKPAGQTLFVAAGDVTGDGQVDVVTGSGDTLHPFLQVLTGPGLGVLQTFTMFPAGFTGPVRVSLGEVISPAGLDILVASAGGTTTLVQVLTFPGLNLIPNLSQGLFGTAPVFLDGVH